MKKFGILIVVLFSINAQSYALQEKILDYKKRAVINISRDDFNRVAIEDDRIESVFGKQNVFVIESDSKQGHLYLMLRNKALDEVSLTLVSESGKTQDLLMKIKDIPAETIIFKTAANDNLYNKDQESKLDYKAIIKEMMQNTNVINATIYKENTSVNKWRDIALTKNRTYKINSFIGEIYTAENKRKKPILFKESDFYFDKEIKAIVVENKFLKPNEVTNIYIVKKYEKTR